jgi:HlyD family secretion protein
MIKNKTTTMMVLCFLSACATSPEEGAGWQGVVEHDEWRLGFEVGGRLSSLAVSRGDRVEKGAALASLDAGLVLPGREARAADLAAAEARLALLRAGARSEDKSALVSQLKAAKSNEAVLDSAIARQESLSLGGAAAPAALEELAAQRSRAQAEREVLEDRLTALRRGARPEEVRAAEAQRDGARAALSAEDARLARYSLASPVAGEVIDVLAEPGEVVSPGAPVLLVLDPERPYIEVFIPQGSLAGIVPGTLALISRDASPEPLCGAVEHIAQRTEFTPRYLFSEKERAQLVVRVRVRVNDPERLLHGGVPVRVELGESTKGRCS